MLRPHLYGLAIILLCRIVHSVRIMNETQLTEKYLLFEKKCYVNFGCFSTNPPFFNLLNRPINFLPQERDVINTRFHLYTRMNKYSGERVVTNDTSSLKLSSFNGTKPSKFIVHGFLDFGDVDWMNYQRIALLNAEDVNVFQVDWAGGSVHLYTQATANTRLVGAEIEHMIRFLEREDPSKAARMENMHIIGHSLGAHIAGYAGERLAGKLGRISGLDPAGPYFDGTHPSVRLDPTDAIFVDAIHTDAHSILTLGFGIQQTVGHIDFFPNGGVEQTDCSINPVTQIFVEGITNGIKNFAACNHLRVYRLYTESISNTQCPFQAYPCKDYEDFQRGNCISCGTNGCARMGYYADRWTPRPGVTGVKMYLDTHGHRNFCRFHTVVRLEMNDPDFRKERGRLFITIHGQGESQEVELTEDPIIINGLSRHQFLLKSTKFYGVPSKIEFRWKHEWIITSPGTIAIIRTPKIKVDVIKIFAGVDNAEYTFCDGFALQTDESRSIYPSRTNRC